SYRPVAVGTHAALGRPGTPSGLTSDPLPWRAGANAKLRSEIIPSPPEQATEPACDHANAHSEPARLSWARLLKRVFDIDIEHCPNCAGSLKIIAAIEDPPVIVKILSHLGLPARAPPRSPAQRFDLFQT